jgi:hypothetical protein
MAPRLETEWRFGPICSVHGLGLHCPACYAAAAFAVMGAGCLLAARRPS